MTTGTCVFSWRNRQQDEIAVSSRAELTRTRSALRTCAQQQPMR